MLARCVQGISLHATPSQGNSSNTRHRCRTCPLRNRGLPATSSELASLSLSRRRSLSMYQKVGFLVPPGLRSMQCENLLRLDQISFKWYGDAIVAKAHISDEPFAERCERHLLTTFSTNRKVLILLCPPELFKWKIPGVSNPSKSLAETKKLLG
jgi:hypothetical protein